MGKKEYTGLDANDKDAKGVLKFALDLLEKKENKCGTAVHKCLDLLAGVLIVYLTVE